MQAPSQSSPPSREKPWQGGQLLSGWMYESLKRRRNEREYCLINDNLIFSWYCQMLLNIQSNWINRFYREKKTGYFGEKEQDCKDGKEVDYSSLNLIMICDTMLRLNQNCNFEFVNVFYFILLVISLLSSLFPFLFFLLHDKHIYSNPSFRPYNSLDHAA